MGKTIYYEDIIKNSDSIMGRVMKGLSTQQVNTNTQESMREKWNRCKADKAVNICPKCDRLWELHYSRTHNAYIDDGVRYGKGKKYCGVCDE
jgi:hypothetical protein